MKTVVLKGYYGRDNFGDELMLELFVEYFKKKKDVKLSIMNSNPDKLLERYGLETPIELVTGSHGKKGIIKRLFTICSSDVYVVGGGTILTDKHGKACLLEYWIEFFIRRVLRKKSILLSVGSTDFKSKLGKLSCKKILENATVVSVRDSISYKQLRSISGKANIVETGDMVTCISDLYPEMLNTGTNQNGSVCICPMPYHRSINENPELDESIAYSMAKLIDALTEKKIQSFMLPIQYGSNSTLDSEFCERIQKLSQSNPPIYLCSNNFEKIERLLEADCIVSMRLHAILVGIIANKKVIAIDHNPKITACMELYNKRDYCVNIDDIGNIEDLILHLKSDNNSSITRDEYAKAKGNFMILDTYI